MKLWKISGKFFLIIISIVLVTLSLCSPRQKVPAIDWSYDLDSALTIAAQSQKPLMIDFMATWCPPCKAMEETTFVDPAVIAKSKKFVTVRIDVDKQSEIANKYNGNARKYGGVGIPNLLFITAGQDTLRHIVGFFYPAELAAIMDSVLFVYNPVRTE